MLNVFITGASTGIGAALARQYASRGAVVGLVARNRDKLEALADALREDETETLFSLATSLFVKRFLRRLKSLSDFPVALL